MNAKVLEARLVVAGDDKTGKMFAAIMARMDAVLAKARALVAVSETSERALNSASVAMGRVDHSLAAAAARLDRAAISMEHAAAATARAGREVGARGSVMMLGGAGAHRGGHHGRGAYLAANLGSRHGARHLAAEGGFGVGGMVGAVGAVVAAEGGIHVIESGAARQHERVRADIAGMSPEERKDAEDRAVVLSARYPAVDATSVMHALRNARGVTGSYDEASSLSDEILKMRIVAQAAKPDRDIEHETDLLLKAMEQHGDTMHPDIFRSAMTRINRVLAVEGDTLSPVDIYEAAQYSRQALPSASQRFMYGAAPGVAQEMRGSSFGAGLAAFNRAIVGGRMDGHALRTALQLGLIDPSDVVMGKKDKPVRVKTALEGGHGFVDSKLAATDPDLWMYGHIKKALDDRGITDPTKRDQIVGDLFSKGLATNLVTKFLDQQLRIEKNQKQLADAPNDPVARITRDDPVNAWQGAKNAFDNLGAEIFSSGSFVTRALHTVGDWMNDDAARIRGVRTDHMQRNVNKEKYGLDSDRDFSKAPVDDLVEAKRKALADDAAKVMAKRLELKGITDEIAARNAERAGSGFWGRLGFGGRPTSDLTARALAIRTELKDLETAAARLRDLSDAYDRLQRARADQPSAHLINRRDGPAVPGFGHASFPLGSDFSHVDPASGRGWGVPAPPSIAPSPGYGSDSQDRIVRALAASPYGSLGPKPGPSGPIEAELKGSADVNVKVAVEPSSNLLTIVKKAETAAASGNLRMNLGSGAPGTGPAGRTPSGR